MNVFDEMEVTEGGIQCDNPSCDWEDETVTFENSKEWINRPCPKCGENLLTEEDYHRSEVLHATVDFMKTLTPEDMEALQKISLKDNPELQQIIDQLPEGPAMVQIQAHNGFQITVEPLESEGDD